MMRLVLIAGIIVTLGIGFLAAQRLLTGGGDISVRSSGRALVGGPFTLTAHTGERVTPESFSGRMMLIYFGYTYCPDVCPLELTKMAQALDALGPEAERVTPILITVDPARDTVAALAAYMGHFGPRFVGLTGTPEEIRIAADAYRVYYKRQAADGSSGDYLMDHSSIIYLMNESGEFLDHFTPGTTPDAMAETIRGYL